MREEYSRVRLRKMKNTANIIPIFYIQNLINVLSEYGIEKHPLLANSGVQENVLNDAAGLINFEQQFQIVSNAAVLSPIPHLGLELGKRQHIYNHGVFGYAVQSCADLKQMLEITVRYHKLSGVHQQLELQTNDNDYVILFKDSIALPGLHRMLIEEYMASISNSLAEVAAEKIAIKHLAFDYPEPEYVSLYHTLFNCPIHFNAPYCELAIDRIYGDVSLKSHDPQTSTLCTQRCEEILSRLNAESPIVQQVREILLKLPCDKRNAEAVATQQHVSPRQLRRKLNDEDTSFQKVLDEIRLELSKDYLCQTNLSIDQIAPLVGFAESSNFRRAFKKWTNQAPSDYRKLLA